MANQNDAVMQFVQGLAQTLQADPNEIIQIAQQNPDALKSAVQVYQQTQDMQQAAQAFQQSVSQQTQKAAHGAKLNYLRKLKNKCAEDEELVYYKRGGSLDCGCVKKQETGGKTPKKQTPIEKYKDQATKDSIEVNKYGNDDIPNKKPGDFKKNKQGKVQWTPDRNKAPYKKAEKGTKLLKRGCPKCGKVHSAGIGCSVAAFKQKFQQGGEFRLPELTVVGTNRSNKSRAQLMREQMKIANEQYNDRPQVLRADRTAEGTAKPTSTYSRYKTFKEAYNAARKNKDMYFDFKGKVYRSYDNPNSSPTGFRNNKAEMEARYGKYLGWRKDPNLGTKSIQHTTDIKNQNLGDTSVQEQSRINPAEVAQRNKPGEINGNWQLYENWKPEDYYTLANKTAATGAAVAGAAMTPMFMGTEGAWQIGNGLQRGASYLIRNRYVSNAPKFVRSEVSRWLGGKGNPINGGSWYQNLLY